MTAPIKVLMTADCVGGVWTYALDLAEGLAPHGVEVTLALLGPSPSPASRDVADGIANLRLIETGLPLDWTAEDAGAIVRAGERIAELASELGSDLVHLNSPALAAGVPFPCPILGVCHSCVATWWQAVRGDDLPTDFRWRTDLVAAGYAAADLLIAPSAAFARDTAAAYRLAKTPAVIHNGRRAMDPASAGPSERPREAFVLTAGRLWDEGKNVAMLDRVAARLAVPVLAAGSASGPNGAAIEFRHARALGYVDPAALADLLAARPVFASLALYEPFGLAVLEAAQAGCPLVLSDIPSFRELWDGAALFVDPHDENAASSALSGLLANRAERDRLGAVARARSHLYTVQRMSEATATAYRTVLNQAAGRIGRTQVMSAA